MEIPYATFGDPQTLNLYGYVRNNPLAKADLVPSKRSQSSGFRPTDLAAMVVTDGCDRPHNFGFSPLLAIDIKEVATYIVPRNQ
jgi:hypothetical protein